MESAFLFVSHQGKKTVHAKEVREYFELILDLQFDTREMKRDMAFLTEFA